MILIYFILLLVLIVGVIITTRSFKRRNNKTDILFSVGILITVIIPPFLYFVPVRYTEKEAYKKALRGNNPYEMEITYTKQDSVCVPTDTTYIYNLENH